MSQSKITLTVTEDQKNRYASAAAATDRPTTRWILRVLDWCASRRILEPQTLEDMLGDALKWRDHVARREQGEAAGGGVPPMKTFGLKGGGG